MNHLLVAPIAIPALAGAVLVLLDRTSIRVQRWTSGAATLAFAVCALALLAQAADGVPVAYALGNWPVPFGIVLVLDRLSGWMVGLTAVVATGALAYAMHGWDARGRFFHALFQFQLMGLAGAFLTGDLFNLFVFFEVMLIASYCLMLQGLGAARLRATLHYVAINVTTSGVFLLAASLLYGVSGTLNMAHLAERLPVLGAEELVLARAAGLLLVGVFCVKAAVFPLYFWLPAGYSIAAAPVAALFSIMTKVGVYSIVRVTSLVYGEHAGAAGDLLAGWLLPLALVTLALGALGALGAERLGTMIAYLTIASVGTMLIAVSAGKGGLAAALYYLAHSTLVIAILFLVADLLARQRGPAADVLHPGPALVRAAGLGVVFLIAGATVAGVPPSSGFMGKMMVLQSWYGAGAAGWVWTVVLATSVIMVVACARAGSLVLWNVGGPAAADGRAAARSGEWAALLVLLACSALLVVLAGPARSYGEATAAQLATPSVYIGAVLGPRAGDSVRALPSGANR